MKRASVSRTSHLEIERRVSPFPGSIRVISGAPRLIIRHDYSRSRCTHQSNRGIKKRRRDRRRRRRREAIEFHAAASSASRRSSRGAHHGSSRPRDRHGKKVRAARRQGEESWVTTEGAPTEAGVTRRIAFPRELDAITRGRGERTRVSLP